MSQTIPFGPIEHLDAQDCTAVIRPTRALFDLTPLPSRTNVHRLDVSKPAAKPQSVAAARESLSATRDALLNLHKRIIDSERERYEHAIGPIQSPNHFLQLLTTDPWFAWLHPLSQLIVAMDELLEGKEPLTVDTADALLKQAGALLVAAENAQGFSGHYHAALQHDPDVVLAHAEVIKLIGRKTPSS